MLRRKNQPRGRLLFLPLIASAVTLAGCAPQGVTEQGRAIHNLYNFFMYLAVGVFVIVAGLIVWSIIRYRRRDDELPRQTHGNSKLELLWTLIPLVLVVILFQQTVVTQNKVTAMAAQPQTTVDVLGFQWQWQFTYLKPDGSDGSQIIGTLQKRPELVLPTGRSVRIRLRSADVVHSFYVPRTLYKEQAIPGRTNEFDMTFDQPGVYNGHCAFYCGLSHARMTFSVRVVSPEEFDRWLAQQASTTSGQ